MMSLECFFCHKDPQIIDRAGRQETCPQCGRALHICKNCEFYDPSAYNECRETQADRVVDKETANFCDYFHFSNRSYSGAVVDPKEEARRQLERLFKK